MAELLEGASAAATALARAAVHAPLSRLAAAIVGSPQPAVGVPVIHIAPMQTATAGTSLAQEVQNWAAQWQPV
ncbi:MAG TPA: hypothetical protein VH115_05415, partial [Solirubrobacteraceae bacterium]|nr:hypothetical protein [Solirubrobacteraceae bacterium]